MKKKLAINASPIIRTYTYHGFHHAIVSTKDKVNETVAKVNVTDFSKHDWHVKSDCLTYKIDQDNTIEFKSNKWNVGMDIIFWRTCNDFDEIEIRILEQIYSSIYGQINVFIADETQSENLKDNNHLMRVGRFNKDGIYIKMKDEFRGVPKIEKNLPLSLKLVRCDNKITLYYKNEKEDYLCLHSEENEVFHSNKLRIGFEVLLGNNMYYEWLFSNYIHISGDVNVTIMNVDYLWNCNKNWNYYTTNFLVNYNVETVKNIQSYGMTVLEFLEKNIDLDRYIELNINENIINSISDDFGPFFHQNLVYGYDEEERVLFIMNYVDGRTKLRSIKYDDFESDRNALQDDANITLIQYLPDSRGYELDIRNIKKKFMEYRDSIDPEIDNELHCPNCNYSYGIQVLHDFCNEIGIIRMTFDIRNSHLLFERSKLMLERIDYFLCRGIINQEQYKDLMQVAKKSFEITFIIRNMVMKYIVNHKNNFTSVKIYLEQLIENEIELCNKMISCLEECHTY